MSDERTDSAAPEPPTSDPSEQAATLSEELAERAQEITAQLQDLLPEPPASPLEPAVEAPVSEHVSPELPAAVELEAVEAAAPESLPEPLAASRRVKRLLAPGEPIESDSDDRMLSALAWASMVLLQLPVVSVVQLLSDNTKHRRFQQHHAVTSLLFYVASFVYEIAAAVVFTILGAVTLGCGYACLWLIFLVPHALALYYALQAYNGRSVELPGLSNYARKQGWL